MKHKDNIILILVVAVITVFYGNQMWKHTIGRVQKLVRKHIN